MLASFNSCYVIDWGTVAISAKLETHASQSHLLHSRLSCLLRHFYIDVLLHFH